MATGQQSSIKLQGIGGGAKNTGRGDGITVDKHWDGRNESRDKGSRLEQLECGVGVDVYNSRLEVVTRKPLMPVDLLITRHPPSHPPFVRGPSRRRRRERRNSTFLPIQSGGRESRYYTGRGYNPYYVVRRGRNGPVGAKTRRTEGVEREKEAERSL